MQGGNMRADLVNPNIPKWLIIGECGDGKSTLINQLVGKNVATAGRNAKGVTKQLGFYKGEAIDGVVIDTPGVGDIDIKTPQLIELMGIAFESIDIHGVIVCSKEYSRVKMGGQIVSRIVNMAFKSRTKWNNVIFCWTQGDKAEAEDIENLPHVLKTCMDDIKVSERPPFCVTMCPPNGTADIAPLVKILDRVAKQQGIGKYVPPPPKEMAIALGEVTGMDTAELYKQLEEARKNLHAMQQKMMEELKKVGDNFQKELKEANKKYDEKVEKLRVENKEVQETMAKERKEEHAALLQRMDAEREKERERYEADRREREQRYQADMDRIAQRCAPQGDDFFGGLVKLVTAVAPLFLL